MATQIVKAQDNNQIIDACIKGGKYFAGSLLFSHSVGYLGNQVSEMYSENPQKLLALGIPLTLLVAGSFYCFRREILAKSEEFVKKNIAVLPIALGSLFLRPTELAMASFVVGATTRLLEGSKQVETSQRKAVEAGDEEEQVERKEETVKAKEPKSEMSGKDRERLQKLEALLMQKLPRIMGFLSKLNESQVEELDLEISNIDKAYLALGIDCTAREGSPKRQAIRLAFERKTENYSEDDRQSQASSSTSIQKRANPRGIKEDRQRAIQTIIISYVLKLYPADQKLYFSLDESSSKLHELVNLAMALEDFNMAYETEIKTFISSIIANNRK